MDMNNFAVLWERLWQFGVAGPGKAVEGYQMQNVELVITESAASLFPEKSSRGEDTLSKTGKGL